MAVSAYMYFLFYRVDREHRNTKTDFWTPTAGLWGSETRAFRVEAPCFSQKEVSIFRKCLLLSGEMLTSFSEKPGFLTLPEITIHLLTFLTG